MEKKLKNKVSELVQKLKKKKTPSKEGERKEDKLLPKVFGIPQVHEKDNITTILFETGPSAFYSDTRKEPVLQPDVLVLHKNDEGNFLMTWCGTVEHTYTETVDYDAYTSTEYEFETKGMYELNGQQAKALLTSPENLELFKETLAGIEKQENLKRISLTKNAEKQRSAFIKKDFELAKKVRNEYLDVIKAQDKELRKKKDQQIKAETEQRKNAETERFLNVFSKFDEHGK